ncbi:MAG: hypothetical protein H6Q97_1009, partial [Nitrospirae bacterium]|nr:hypothetical protein [Nitrospirota bacterium]
MALAFQSAGHEDAVHAPLESTED